MTTLKEMLENAGVAVTPEEEVKENEVREQKHRHKTVVERPTIEYNLLSLDCADFEPKKYQKDPTDDLVVVPLGMNEVEAEAFFSKYGDDAYLVWCPDTCSAWLCPTLLCLNQNFIYRLDVQIVRNDSGHLVDFYMEVASMWLPSTNLRKSCYILDNPANEKYEVYYDSNYPSLKYGKATPNGMFVHKYANRFHRDMAIMELDDLYTNHSSKKAGEVIAKGYGATEAIVVSDGCFKSNVCSCAVYYLDNETLIKFTQGIVPSEPDQSALISEIKGATNALKLCQMNGKKDITYYYDNTSILNVFRNRKMGYIQEIVAYKELLKDMDASGYNINFVELHPKTGESRDEENRALMYFHNYCDTECDQMADIFTKDYRMFATNGSREGKTYKQVQKESRPKSQQRKQNGGSNAPQNNAKNGNNKYGRRF